MLASHYAPGAAVRRRCARGAARRGAARLRADAASTGPDKAVAVLNLSPSGRSARSRGQSLLDDLQALDRSGAATIAVEPIPDHGLGEAINDRLRRAAAPRDLPFDAA